MGRCSDMSVMKFEEFKTLGQTFAQIAYCQNNAMQCHAIIGLVQ